METSIRFKIIKKMMVQIDHIAKSYGNLHAVKEISFGIQPGECLGLLGPNGAGKTTTICMITGLIQPDQGSISIDGQSPQHHSVRRQLGVAPQALAIYNELTAQENLAFFGRLYGLRGKILSDRIDWALRLAGLRERQRDRTGTFSGGMKRRLNIAVALVHQPKLLLLDEPTVGVDPQSRNHIFDWILQLKSEGITILYTTHYMEEAQRLCDRVAIVDHGKLLVIDNVDNLLRQHGGKSIVSGQIDKLPTDYALPGQVEEDNWRFETDTPFETMAKISSEGVSFRSIQINGPDLESVFLSLTGRGLRD